MADISDTIQTAAAKPASTEVDGTASAARPLLDLIEADRYLAAKAGAKTRNRGLRFSKILPAGAVSDQQGTATGTNFDQPGGG